MTPTAAKHLLHQFKPSNPLTPLNWKLIGDFKQSLIDNNAFSWKLKLKWASKLGDFSQHSRGRNLSFVSNENWEADLSYPVTDYMKQTKWALQYTVCKVLQ